MFLKCVMSVEPVIFTHTQTLVFLSLWGHPIGIMVFILYKLYFLSPYPNATRKPSPKRKLSAFLDFQNTSFCKIYKIVSSWGPKTMYPQGQNLLVLPYLWDILYVVNTSTLILTLTG